MTNKYLWYRFFILTFLTLVTANEVVFAQNKIIEGAKKSIGKNCSYVHPAILVKEIPTVSLPPRVRNKVITVETPLPTLPSMVERVSTVAELHTPFHGNTTPADLISIEEGRFISLGDLLKAYYPIDNLSTKLNPAQIRAVRRAVKETDKIFFTRGDQGQIIPKQQEDGAFDCEKEFERQLLMALEKKGLAITDFPWNFVMGGRGRGTAPLHHYLKIISLELYIYTHGGAPSEIEKRFVTWISYIKHNRDELLPVRDIVISLYNPASDANKDFLKRLQEFVTRDNRFPSTCTSEPEEVALANEYYNRKRNHPDDPSIQKAIELRSATLTKCKYNAQQANADLLTRLQEFATRHNRFPGGYASDPEEVKLANAYYHRTKRYSDDPSIQKAIELHSATLTKCKYDAQQANADLLTRLQEFVDRHNRFPSAFASDPEEVTLANEYYNRKRQHPDDPSIQKAIKKRNETLTQYKYNIQQANVDFLTRLQEFVTRHNRFPSTSSFDPKEVNLANGYYRRTKRNPDNPSIKKAIELHSATLTKHKYDIQQTNANFLTRLQEFVTGHNRFPSAYASNQEEGKLAYEYYSRKKRYPDDPSIQKAIELHSATLTKCKYDDQQTNADFLIRLQEFVTGHNRFPSTHASNQEEVKLAYEYYRRTKKHPDDPPIKEAIRMRQSLPRKCK